MIVWALRRKVCKSVSYLPLLTLVLFPPSSYLLPTHFDWFPFDLIYILASSFSSSIPQYKIYYSILFQYSVILLALLIVQIAVGVFAFLEINDGNLQNKIETALKKLFDNYYNNANDAQAADSIQTWVSYLSIALLISF